MSCDSDLSRQNSANGACRGETRAQLARRLLAGNDDTRDLDLPNAITQEIVQRLAMIHQGRDADPPLFDDSEILAFGALVLSSDTTAAIAHFQDLRAQGHSRNDLYLHLLAPTARLLGDFWSDDRCDFFDVTLGLGRLQEILAVNDEDRAIGAPTARRRALLMSPCGESHVFGVEMLSRIMTDAGWNTTLEKNVTLDRIPSLVSWEPIDVAGFTLSAEKALDGLASLITAVRRASCNKAIGVLVGGPLFLERPDLAVQIGADGCAADAPTAISLATQLARRHQHA